MGSENKGPFFGDAAKRAQEAQKRGKELESCVQINRDNIPEDIVLLVIAYDTKSGQSQVSGPLGNKELSYGMLEIARDTIYDWNKNNIPGVQTP